MFSLDLKKIFKQMPTVMNCLQLLWIVDVNYERKELNKMETRGG